MKQHIQKSIAFSYQTIIKPLLFALNTETVHESTVSFASVVGDIAFARKMLRVLFVSKNKSLTQTIAGISFTTPVGLAAGFDYDAKLMHLLPNLGFGFGTVGTVTNKPYKGNTPPRLGRLPLSKSLMVNKGFKNKGAKKIAKQLAKQQFLYPVGISIGQTNTTRFSNQKEAITDICNAFLLFEKEQINNAYYELNISCPNLKSSVDFYTPKKLQQLLQAVFALNITKPLFIKMPIDKTDKQILSLMNIIIQFPVAGIIIGNLQKKRDEPSLKASELAQFPVGNFSGKATWNRSNELISVVYQKYGKKIFIIGCGGIFSADDAYEKILRGASLVQLITGMIFQGPQVISEINDGLVKRAKKDGYSSIAEAVGRFVISSEVEKSHK